MPGAGAFKMVADPAAVNWPMVIAILFVLVIYVTMVYGPIAAILVEMFPTRIRYTGMSLPYHIGNGWFGGLLPATVFALSAAKGDIYYGLWYPIVDRGDDAGHRHAVRPGYARHRPERQGLAAQHSLKMKPGSRKCAGLFSLWRPRQSFG